MASSLVGHLTIFALVLVSIIFAEKTSYGPMAECIRKKWGPPSLNDNGVRCALREMKIIYDQMKTVDCPKCQPYFNCIANSNVAINCESKAKSAETAELVSECYGKTIGQDAVFIDAGNRGRSGLDCAESYLCKASCKYSPETKTCKASACR